MSARKNVNKADVKRLIRQGYSDSEIGRLLGVHRLTARWHRKRFGLPSNRNLKRWTPDDVATARRILAGGGSLWNAARAVGRTPAAVRVALTRHSITEVQ